MESVMTISLSKELGKMSKPRGIRKAASRIRFLVARSAKVDMGFVSIDPEVNNYILSTAIKNRSKVKLNVSKSGNTVKVALHNPKPAAKASENASKKQEAKPVTADKKNTDAKPVSSEAKKEEPKQEKKSAK